MGWKGITSSFWFLKYIKYNGEIQFSCAKNYKLIQEDSAKVQGHELHFQLKMRASESLCSYDHIKNMF